MTGWVGSIVGVVAGLAAAYPVGLAVLATKRWRNAQRVANGLDPFRDLVLVVPWVPCALMGGVVGAIAAMRGGGPVGVSIASVVVPTILFVQIAFAAAIATRK